MKITIPDIDSNNPTSETYLPKICHFFPTKTPSNKYAADHSVAPTIFHRENNVKSIFVVPATIGTTGLIGPINLASTMLFAPYFSKTECPTSKFFVLKYL